MAKYKYKNEDIEIVLEFPIGKQPREYKHKEHGLMELVVSTKRDCVVTKGAAPGKYVTRNRQDIQVMNRIREARKEHQYREDQTPEQDAADKHMFRKNDLTGLKPPKEI